MQHLTAILLLALGAFQSAEVHEPGRDTASVELGKGKVTIEYGTPKLGGRNLDEMIKPGDPWRLGMNNATTLETTVAIELAGKRIKPGKYVLFARPDAGKNWTLLVCTGGSPDTATVEAPLRFSRDSTSIDALKITLEKSGAGASLGVAWGNYRLQGTLKPAA
jgi:hypothetical protein